MARAQWRQPNPDWGRARKVRVYDSETKTLTLRSKKDLVLKATEKIYESSYDWLTPHRHKPPRKRFLQKRDTPDGFWDLDFKTTPDPSEVSDPSSGESTQTSSVL
jgi:hypothetical protein